MILRRTLLVTLIAACGGGGGGSPDAPAIDADVARDDLVPAVGTATTLDIACWNLREFPAMPTTPRVVGDLIASLALDIVAVEEIADRAAFESIVARLPGWEARMPT